jgi:hypothetical protein
VKKKHHGEIRQSQLITTYGPGAMVDLPKHSVVIGGLESWVGADTVIHERRLADKVASLLKLPRIELRVPPPLLESEDAPPAGIGVYLFPEWFVAQVPGKRRPLVNIGRLEKGKLTADDGKRYSAVPVRFVQACIHGHLSDIEWHGFAHTDYETRCRRPLWIEERGASGDLADIWVGCECGVERSMAQATRRGTDSLGFCPGKRPWLGSRGGEKCGGMGGKLQPSRLLIRSASDAYFPQLLRVIALPDRGELVSKAVDKLWDNFLSHIESAAELPGERKKRPSVRQILEGFTDEEVWEAIERRKADVPPGKGRTIKQAEIATLRSVELAGGEDTPEGADFFATRFHPVERGHGPLALVERVVLVHRMKEVVALLGFTRFEAHSPDIEGELELDVQRAPLAKEVTWVPAIENRGEGVFLGFRKSDIDAWLALEPVKTRERRWKAALEAWKARRPMATQEFPGLPYILLHSLSHLLLTAISLDCGYSASSIRERIYAGEKGYGILLYTGSADSEGTLGGLVETGKKVGRYLRDALELGRLCSNDPVCSQHSPDHPHEERFLNGAACHGCLLLAETSCERRNEFLDRSLVVPTVECFDAEFFREEEP